MKSLGIGRALLSGAPAAAVPFRRGWAARGAGGRCVHALLSCILLACPVLVALVCPTTEASGVAVMFDLGRSARSMGMGGASVAVAGETNAGANPALLGWADHIYLESLYSNQFGAATYTSLGLSAPNVAVAGAVLSSGWIVTGEDPLRFDAQGLSCAAGAAFGAVGVGARWRYLHVGTPFSANGWAADVGIAAEFGAVRVGALVEGALSSGMVFDRDRRENWSRTLSVGVGARAAASSQVHVQAAVDWAEALSGTGRVVAGAEILFGKVAGRLGWDGAGLTLGVSIVARRVELDWCSVVRSDLGVSHRVSLQWVLSGGGEGSR